MNIEKKLNVIFFPAWFTAEPNQLGGKFVFEHAKVLQYQVNLSVIHIEANTELNVLYRFSSKKIENFELITLSFRKINNRWLFPINYFLYLGAIGYLFFKERNRYIGSNLNHVHVMTRAAILPYLIKLFYKIPYVISEHWSRYLPEDNTYEGFLRKLITKFFVRKSDGISAVSKALKKALLKFGLDHINSITLPNAVDTNIYKLKRSIVSTGKFTILHVSGLNDEVKNVSGILRATKILLDEGYNFNLTIVGDDEKEGVILRKYAKDIELTNVVFRGKLYGQELIEQYQEADVFVLNSNFENQPRVILEAMSCGLPVIATDVGGTSEMINIETGILIKAKDDRMLASTIAEFINKKVSFDKKLVRGYVVENHGYEKVCSAFVSFYKSVLNSKNVVQR